MEMIFSNEGGRASSETSAHTLYGSLSLNPTGRGIGRAAWGGAQGAAADQVPGLRYRPWNGTWVHESSKADHMLRIYIYQ